MAQEEQTDYGFVVFFVPGGHYAMKNIPPIPFLSR